MANKYYGANVGAGMAGDVTTGTSTTSKDVELNVNTSATGLDKVAILKAVDAIRDRIVQDTFPLS
jgi:hypothetical protein